MKEFTQSMLNIKLWSIAALVIGLLSMGAAIAVLFLTEPNDDLRGFLGYVLPIALILQITLIIILLLPASNAMMKMIGYMDSDKEVSKSAAQGFVGRLVIAMGIGSMGVFLTLASIAMGTDLLAGGILGIIIFAVLFIALAGVEFWCILRPLFGLQKKFGHLGSPSA